MRALRSAAVLAAALSTLLVAPGSASAERGAVATPVVGDCHTLTVDEGAKFSDPDPTVPCTNRHTSITIEVVQLSNPDWSAADALWKKLSKPCYLGLIDALGGNTKKIQLSAYTFYWFGPTKAERDAGASWVRCDAVVLGGGKFVPLPAGTDISLGSLPLGNKLAECRAGKRADYQVLSCSRRHAYRATLALNYPGDTYPGKKAALHWALRHCRAHLDGAFYYESVPSKFSWNLGFRYAVCLPETRS
ncbi:hypothetical protein [Nocardioides panacisoli]|uniref:Septum formation-related domain-containing protein n=1 Tax=Nocardioides panacisoli TaxID=627624 RepID=A0ABP7IVH6_9ACTN